MERRLGVYQLVFLPFAGVELFDAAAEAFHVVFRVNRFCCFFGILLSRITVRAKMFTAAVGVRPTSSQKSSNWRFISASILMDIVSRGIVITPL